MNRPEALLETKNYRVKDFVKVTGSLKTVSAVLDTKAAPNFIKKNLFFRAWKKIVTARSVLSLPSKANSHQNINDGLPLQVELKQHVAIADPQKVVRVATDAILGNAYIHKNISRIRSRKWILVSK